MSTIVRAGHRDRGAHEVPFRHVVSPMSYFGEAVYTAFTDVSRIAGKVAKTVSVKLRERASVRAVSNLDDHTLADIGIRRSDIYALSRRVAEDPGFDHRSVY